MTPRFRPTARSRIALTLTGLVMAAGVILLAASYELVRVNIASVTVTPAAPRRPAAGPGMVPAGGAPAPAFRALLAQHTLSVLAWQYTAIVAALLAVSAAVAWLVAGRILRPVRTITATAQRITSQDLHERLRLPGPSDELGQLADTLDSMLGRLETAFQAEQLFAASAAHQLRTPLAVLGAELELLATDPGSDRASARDSAVRMRRTVVSLQQLLEKLLTLTCGAIPAEDRQPVRLDQLAAARLTLAEGHAAGQAVTLTQDLAPVTAPGDPALLAELIDNLLDNASRYNHHGGHVQVRTRALAASAILEVTNTGPRITAQEADGLLEPFRRATRQRIGAGHGLGLPVVRAITTAHDGHVSLQALEHGGLHVQVSLPAG